MLMRIYELSCDHCGSVDHGRSVKNMRDTATWIFKRLGKDMDRRMHHFCSKECLRRYEEDLQIG